MTDDQKWLKVLTKEELFEELKPTADKVRLIEIHCEQTHNLLLLLLTSQGGVVLVLSLLLYFAIR